ncbi:MAG: FGGY-family carbohydrate kinase [Lachnospiraceae bacterium]|nr:FGGY-family carbohydrate kinase [Lachnospiraceae bacterium]
MLVLGLEASTTSAKAMLYDSETGVLALETESYRKGPAPAGHEEGMLDAETAYRKLMAVGARAAKGRPVDCIAVSATWQSLLVCDAKGTPILPIMLWSCRRAEEISRQIGRNKEQADRIYRRTGAVVNASYPLFKLLYLKKEGYDLAGLRFCGGGSYLTKRMTGEELVTESMASGSGLFNGEKRGWDTEILSALGIHETQFFPLGSYRDTKPLAKEAAELLGVKQGIPVVPAEPDGGLDQIGAKAMEEGVMTFSMGTSGSLRLRTDGPRKSKTPGTWCYLAPTGEWLSGIGTSGCTNCVDWVKEKFFPPGTSYREIEKSCRLFDSAPIFLPFVFGERGPAWANVRKGGFVNILGEHGPEAFYYAVLEGVLFNLYQCYELLCEVNETPHTVKLSGGVLHSPVWSAMCADLFGRELEVVSQKHSSVLGAVALGLVTSGRIRSVREFRALPKEEKRTIVPGGNRGYYMERYREYLKFFHGSLLQ